MTHKSNITFPLAAILISLALPANGHTPAVDGITSLDQFRRPQQREIVNVPDIAGYTTLKCDLHMHTVFSDGLVWPSIRVQEAWGEGLDVIAITDHIEYTPHKADIPVNHNRPYELAEEAARMAGLILIRGSEITRSTPPGHFNAVFIQDASGFIENRGRDNPDLDYEAVDMAAQQNAFIFWNHPGWKVTSIKDSYDWIPLVERLRAEGKLHGIEVINGFELHNKALDWALEKGLTVLGSSDIHNLVEHEYDTQNGARRTMTLLFATERSREGVREALDAGRSVAWSSRILAGSEKWVRALYDASVTVHPVHAVDRKGNTYAQITNNSAFAFDLKRLDPNLVDWPESISLNPGTSRIIRFKRAEETDVALYSVTNAYVGGHTRLVVEIAPDLL